MDAEPYVMFRQPTPEEIEALRRAMERRMLRYYPLGPQNRRQRKRLANAINRYESAVWRVGFAKREADRITHRVQATLTTRSPMAAIFETVTFRTTRKP